MPMGLQADGAVSDVIATMFLLGATVVLVTAVGLSLASHPATSATIRELHATASGTAGDRNITLLHTGGDAWNGTQLRIVVALNGAKLYDGPGPNVMWTIGRSIAVGPLSSNLVPGAGSVTIVSRAEGRTLESTDLRIQTTASGPNATTPGSFTVTLAVDGGQSPIIVQPPGTLLVEARAGHAEGRKFIRYAYANLTSLLGPAWSPLADDGTGGDRIAGDGVFSANVLVPANLTSGTYSLSVGLVDLNGTSVNASTNVTIDVRTDVTELSSNPTLTPNPNGTAPCPTGTGQVMGYWYRLNNENRSVNALRGQVTQGDNVTANFAVASNCVGVTVSLVSYKAPTPYFSWSNANQSTLFDSKSVTMGTGAANLTISVPTCDFQVDLVLGSPLVTQGPQDTNNFYSRQGRLIDADNGGTVPCR